MEKFCREQITMVLKNSIYDVVAYDNNEAIGMGRLIGDGLYYTIVDIVVNPQYQGNGIGRYIINKILDYVNTTTPNGGRVSIQLISEKGKEDFYEKMGFKRLPNEYCGHGMSNVLYKKE